MHELLSCLSVCLRRVSGGGKGVVATFSVVNVRAPLPSHWKSLLKDDLPRWACDEIRLNIHWRMTGLIASQFLTQTLFWFFAFLIWLLSEWLVSVPGHTRSLGSLQPNHASWLWIPEVIQPSNYSSKAWIFFSWPGHRPRWNIYTSLFITYYHLGDFLNMRKHFL